MSITSMKYIRKYTIDSEPIIFPCILLGGSHSFSKLNCKKTPLDKKRAMS